MAISSLVPMRPMGTPLTRPALSCFSSSAFFTRLLTPGVSIGPGLTALTRMWRSLRSAVHERAKERTAALVALYTLNAGIPFIETIEALRMMEAPSFISGKAFCTVKRSPLTLLLKVLSKCSSVMDEEQLSAAGVGKENVDAAFLLLDRLVETIEIGQIGDIAAHRGHILADLLYGGVEFSLAPAGNEYVGAFVGESLGCGQADAAVASGNDSYFSFVLGHTVLLWVICASRGAVCNRTVQMFAGKQALHDLSI